MKDSDEYYTAIHEAGHAVAHLYFGLKFKDVNIIPEGIYAGCVTPSKISKSFKRNIENCTLTAKQERSYRHECISLMAGPVAYAKYKKSKKILNIISKKDEDMVSEFANFLEIPPSGKIYFLNLNIELAKDLFTDNKNPHCQLWKFTKSLANHLQVNKRLSYRKCLELYKKECLFFWCDFHDCKVIKNERPLNKKIVKKG